ncbi:Coiled-coil domain-containing protein 61 [Coelomomyces lativittatus]|nr:Coiled-coil domain-containing protein 61 [Coelomomyces lativittatus]
MNTPLLLTLCLDIENITKKTGNFKRFHTFIEMLLSAMKKNNPNLFLDLLAPNDLQHFKVHPSFTSSNDVVKPTSENVPYPPFSTSSLSSKLHHPTSSSNKNSSFSQRRYLILSYTSTFDRVHYPIPLHFQPCHEDPMVLIQFIHTLKRENQQLKQQLRDLSQGQHVLKKEKDQTKILETALLEVEYWKKQYESVQKLSSRSSHSSQSRPTSRGAPYEKPTLPSSRSKGRPSPASSSRHSNPRSSSSNRRASSSSSTSMVFSSSDRFPSSSSSSSTLASGSRPRRSSSSSSSSTSSSFRRHPPPPESSRFSTSHSRTTTTKIPPRPPPKGPVSSKRRPLSSSSSSSSSFRSRSSSISSFHSTSSSSSTRTSTSSTSSVSHRSNPYVPLRSKPFPTFDPTAWVQSHPRRSGPGPPPPPSMPAAPPPTRSWLHPVGTRLPPSRGGGGPVAPLKKKKIGDVCPTDARLQRLAAYLQSAREELRGVGR